MRLFISSPSDVFPERERVDRVVQRLNAGLGGAVRIETERWEGNYYTADSTFQSQIVDPGLCDLVVSIFWQRLGSELPPEFERMPDGRPYPSGTVYEIARALKARADSKRGLPDVLVYRKVADAAVPMTNRERYRQAHEQREAFLAFWEEWFVSGTGHFKAAYNKFETTDQFEREFEQHLRAWLRDHGYLQTTATWSLAEKGSPFRGLEPFDADHEDVFFGRASDIDNAIERLGRTADRGTRFLLLIGESGSGKSSLARAGLIPHIRRGALGGGPENWRVAIVRPGADVDPLAALGEAMFREGALPELAEGDFPAPQSLSAIMGESTLAAGASIRKALGRARDGLTRRLASSEPQSLSMLLVIDQMEELFSPSVDPARAERFMAAIGDLAAGENVVVIGTLRSDIYAALPRLPSLLKLKGAGETLDVTTPDAAAIAQIVRAPASAAGLEFGRDPETGEKLDAIIIRAATGRDVLPLLQFTLTRLYQDLEQRIKQAGRTIGTADKADLVLSAADYAAFGGLEGAVGEEAEKAVGALGAEAQAQLPRLLRSLAEFGGADGGVAAVRLCDMAWEDVASDPASEALANALLAARILVGRGSAATDADDGAKGHAPSARRIRLTHEAVLRTWPRAAKIVADHRDFFRVRGDVMAAQRRWVRYRDEHGGRGGAELLLPKGVALAEAEDIRRRFAGELAPEVVGYVDQSSRRSRWQQRILAAAVVIFALMAAGAGGAAWFATQAERTASRNFDLAVDQADSLTTTVAAQLKDLAGVSKAKTIAILQATEAQFDRIAKIDPNNDRLLESRARMLALFAEDYIVLRDVDDATKRSQECVAIMRKLTAAAPEDLDRANQLSICLGLQGDSANLRNDSTESVADFQETVTIARRLVQKESNNSAWQYRLSVALGNYGSALEDIGKNDEALAARQEGLAIMRKLVAQYPDDVDYIEKLAAALDDVGGMLLDRKHQEDEAISDEQQAVALLRRLVAQDQTNSRWQYNLAHLLSRLAGALTVTNKFDEALPILEEAVKIRRDLVAQDPDNTQVQTSLAFDLKDIASLFRYQGKLEEAFAPIQESVAILRPLLARDNDSNTAAMLSASLRELGEIAAGSNKIPEALAAYQEGTDIARRFSEADQGNVRWQAFLAIDLINAARIRAALRSRDEALGNFQEGVATYRNVVAHDEDNPVWLGGLAEALQWRGDPLIDMNRQDEALADYRESLGINRRIAGSNSANEGKSQVAKLLDKVGRVSQDLRRMDEALAAFQELADIGRDVVKDAPQDAKYLRDLGTVLDKIGFLLFWQNRDEEALATFREGLAICKRRLTLDPNDATARSCPPIELRSMAEVQRDEGHDEEALKNFDAAIQAKPDYANAYFGRGITRLYTGQLDAAIQDIATVVKVNPKYAYNVMWLHIARKRAGQDDKQELTGNAANLDRAAWPWPVVALYLGMSDAAAVQAAAAIGPDDITRQDQVCEANFYVGEFDMESGNRTAATPLLQAAVKDCPRPFYEFFAANRELARPPAAKASTAP
jgi:eukaryotic-like serine/threonine-protein kinase